MKQYKIEFERDGQYTIQNWSGYGEQSAIAQCFLSEALHGARSLKVLEIEEIY